MITNFTAPYTVYFVAVVWIHKALAQHLLCSDAFVVSGKTPLLVEEAKERGRKLILEKWKTEYGPLSDWCEGAANIINCVVDR